MSNMFDIMKNKFLFPSYFKIIGCFLAIPGFIFGYLSVYQDFYIKSLDIRVGGFYSPEINNFTNELSLASLVIGLLFIAFSRLKQEDELTAKLRLDALHWAVLINYILFFAVEILFSLFRKVGYYELEKFVFDTGHWNTDFSLYNMFTPLVIFIGRFYYLVHYKREAFIISNMKYLPYYPYRLIAKAASLSLLSIIILTETFDMPLIDNIGQWVGESRILIPLSFLIWVFSKTANEDELTTQYRLESMQLAVYVNYCLLLLANFICYGFDFLFVMGINLISMLVFFLIRFNYVCNKGYWQVRRDVKGGLLS